MADVGDDVLIDRQRAKAEGKSGTGWQRARDGAWRGQRNTRGEGRIFALVFRS